MDINRTRNSNVAVRGSFDGGSAQLPRNYVSQASSDGGSSSDEGDIRSRTASEIFQDASLKLDSDIQYLPRFAQSTQPDQRRNSIRDMQDPIDLEKIDNDSAIKLKCGHVFRRDGIASWIAQEANATCPMDRTPIAPEQKTDIAELSSEHRDAILANLNQQDASMSLDELASDGSLASTVQEVEIPEPQNPRLRNRILAFFQNLCR